MTVDVRPNEPRARRDKTPIESSIDVHDILGKNIASLTSMTAQINQGAPVAHGRCGVSFTGPSMDHANLAIRAARESDFESIRQFLSESEFQYPGIDKWWCERVAPEYKIDQRVVLIVESASSVQGLFIGKAGTSAKICTLRLREGVRRKGIGRALVTEGLSRLFTKAPSRFHVTISEAAEQNCVTFFESIGFRQIATEISRYRNGIDEFIYGCPAEEVREVINTELSHGIDPTLFGVYPRVMPNERTILMSLKPEFANLVLQGRKSIEFRRRFSTKYEGATIVFYVTHPVRQFMFTATIKRVDRQKTSELWNRYECEGGVAESVFQSYFCGTSHGYAIHLSDIREIPNQVFLDDARQLMPNLRPPQSFQLLDAGSPLIRVLDLPTPV